MTKLGSNQVIANTTGKPDYRLMFNIYKLVYRLRINYSLDYHTYSSEIPILYINLKQNLRFFYADFLVIHYWKS